MSSRRQIVQQGRIFLYDRLDVALNVEQVLDDDVAFFF